MPDNIQRKIFGKYWHNLDIPRHLHIFSDTNLEKILSDSNLKKEKIIYSRNSGVEVKSLYNFFNIQNRPVIHNFLVSLFNPLTFFFSIFSSSSTITIIAKKRGEI